MSDPVLVGIPAGPAPEWALKILSGIEELKKISAQRANAPLEPHLKSKEVMERLGFKDGNRFWNFVRENRVPHIRLNARNIVFPRDAFKAWEMKRFIGERPIR